MISMFLLRAHSTSFGRKNAHGAIAGWKSFVKLRHAAADSRRGIQQVDFESAARQIERCLNAGYTGAANQHRPNRFIFQIDVIVNYQIRDSRFEIPD